MPSKHYRFYDELVFHLWFDVIAMAPPRKEDAAIGINLLVKFLMSEIKRRQKMELEGQSSVVRRGLAMPNSLINEWAYATLEEGHRAGVPPSRELLELIYQRLNCTHLGRRNEKPASRSQALKMLRDGKHVREIARKTGVHASTVMQWRDNEIERERYSSEFADLQEKTRVLDFYR